MKLFSDKKFNKSLWELTLPLSFQSLMLALVATADALMLGHLSQESMAAVSLATQIQFVQNMIIFSAISVLNILGAQYWGKKDERSLNDVFFIALKVCVICSALFFVGCVFFPGTLMKLFASDQVLIEIGSQYLRVAGWSYLLTGISQCYLGLMKLTGNAKQAAAISSFTVILNIILNAIFIFGFAGIIPAFGAKGAAIATLSARVVEIIWSILFYSCKSSYNIDYSRILHNNALLIKDYMKNLFPLVGAQLFWGVGFTSYTAFMGHLGTDAAAANSIAAVVRDLICCICNGICSAGGIIIGNELGAGELDTAKEHGDKLAVMSFLVGIVSTILMLILTPAIMPFIKLNPAAHNYLIGMMIIMAVYMIGRTVNTIVINGVFAAGGDTMFDMYSLAVVMWGIAIPLAALGTFVFHWPVLLVYACTCLDEVGKIPWVMYHFKKYKWVKNLTR